MFQILICPNMTICIGPFINHIHLKWTFLGYGVKSVDCISEVVSLEMRYMQVTSASRLEMGKERTCSEQTLPLSFLAKTICTVPKVFFGR